MINAKHDSRTPEGNRSTAASNNNIIPSDPETWEHNHESVPVIISGQTSLSSESIPMTLDEKHYRFVHRHGSDEGERLDSARMTPKSGISRESSSTNINSLFMRKIEGLAKASPNRGALSFQSQQRSPNIVKVGEEGAGARPYSVNNGDVDKKRLVDQFYNSINENAASSSTTELASKRGQVSTQGSTPIASGMHSPIAEQTFRFVEQVADESGTAPHDNHITSDKLNSLLRNGGFSYNAASKRMVRDQELTDYMLNIDNISAEVARREFNGQSSLEALVQITGRIAEGVHVTQTTLDDRDGPVESMAELQGLQQYLSTLRANTLELTHKLTHNREVLRTGYRTDINDSMGRLHDLLGDLTVLEQRLNRIKERINTNKTVMSQEVLEKLEVLESIDNRFTEHSRMTRNRRFKQLNIFLTVAVVVVSCYYGLRLR